MKFKFCSSTRCCSYFEGILPRSLEASLVVGRIVNQRRLRIVDDLAELERRGTDNQLPFLRSLSDERQLKSQIAHSSSRNSELADSPLNSERDVMT